MGSWVRVSQVEALPEQGQRVAQTVQEAHLQQGGSGILGGQLGEELLVKGPEQPLVQEEARLLVKRRVEVHAQGGQLRGEQTDAAAAGGLRLRGRHGYRTSDPS